MTKLDLKMNYGLLSENYRSIEVIVEIVGNYDYAVEIEIEVDILG